MKLKLISFAVLAALTATIVFLTLRHEEQLDKMKHERIKLLSELYQRDRIIDDASRRLFEAKYSLTKTELTKAKIEDNSEALEAELQASRRTLKITQADLEQILRPMNEDILSSALRTCVGHDEILVTGGYQTSDGNIHYAFVEPFKYTDTNGSEVIRLKTKQLSIPPSLAEVFGLETLITSAGNTLQHGEIWEISELHQTEMILEHLEGTDMHEMPDIIVNPGSKAKIQVGDYRLSTRSNILPDDSGFDIEFRMEQQREQVDKQTPQ